MTFTEAAAEVLRIAGKPLHYKEITELAIEKNLLSHVGKSPEVTMGARLAALLKKEDKANPIVRMKPGVFALREWEAKKKRQASPEGDDANDDDDDGSASDGTEVNALEVEAAHAAPQVSARAVTPKDDSDDDDDELIVSGEDALRNELAASGADMFDDEDDDDQPILAGPSGTGADAARTGSPASAADRDREFIAGEGAEGGRRRRRRRRRRGGRDGDAQDPRSTGSPAVPSGASASGENEATVETARDPLAPPARPMVRDRQQIMAGGAPTGIDLPVLPPGESEDLAGRELADATVMILSGFDRTQGPVQVRAVVDGLVRRGRLGTESRDFALATAQLLACLRADNMRREATGQRARFRFAPGPRVALTDWALGSELVRLELDAIAAVERYREASRRALLRKMQDLPSHALLELLLLGLERIGMSQIRGIRRPGSPGGEAHFAAVHRTGTDEIRTAIVVRKDGREVGRERVSDLRGTLHHYGPATAGWILTTGQVLSGAREEASAAAAPIALFDGVALCRMLEDHGVGVLRTHLTTTIPDLEFFDTLRG
jgi:hypothetical protein